MEITVLMRKLQMKSSHIIHPNKFCIDGFVFKVVSDCVLSEAQAAEAAVHFFKTNQTFRQNRSEIHTVDIRQPQNASDIREH